MVNAVTYHAGVMSFAHTLGIKVSQKQSESSAFTYTYIIMCGNLSDRGVAYSPSDHQGSNVESCYLIHLTALLSQFSLRMHKNSSIHSCIHTFSQLSLMWLLHEKLPFIIFKVRYLERNISMVQKDYYSYRALDNTIHET